MAVLPSAGGNIIPSGFGSHPILDSIIITSAFGGLDGGLTMLITLRADANGIKVYSRVMYFGCSTPLESQVSFISFLQSCDPFGIRRIGEF